MLGPCIWSPGLGSQLGLDINGHGLNRAPRLGYSGLLLLGTGGFKAFNLMCTGSPLVLGFRYVFDCWSHLWLPDLPCCGSRIWLPDLPGFWSRNWLPDLPGCWSRFWRSDLPGVEWRLLGGWSHSCLGSPGISSGLRLLLRERVVGRA